MNDVVLPIPEPARQLWAIQQELKRRYSRYRLSFTLDGKLVGDLAEALVLEHYDVSPPPKRAGGIDAIAADKRTVQVKATGCQSKGPSFSYGRGSADLLIFLCFDFERGEARVIYNGPEAPIRSVLPNVWSGTKTVKIGHVQACCKDVTSDMMVARRGHN